jgi:hypothetical protein
MNPRAREDMKLLREIADRKKRLPAWAKRAVEENQRL